MRASPACQFTLKRSGAWCRLIAALSACVVVALVFWCVWPSDGLSAWRTGAATLAAVAVFGLNISLTRMSTVSLRWDGQRWQLGQSASMGHESVMGELSVPLDLGNWMLLRFQADVAKRRSKVTWLPVQRVGIEAQWHALRCAVYSPRPERDAAPAALR